MQNSVSAMQDNVRTQRQTSAFPFSGWWKLETAEKKRFAFLNTGFFTNAPYLPKEERVWKLLLQKGRITFTLQGKSLLPTNDLILLLPKSKQIVSITLDFLLAQE